MPKEHLFVRRLLRWFQGHRRTYPWRETRDPYRVFLAEFMLQRTGGQQVLPVYMNFVQRFPTLHDAARVDEATLRRFLHPLGRVKRVRVFQKAVRHIAENLGGRLPASLDRLRKVPGVGTYTARAILVFAYRRRLGLFDPNIYRVVGRVFGVTSGKSRPHTDTTMWQTIDVLIPKGRSREMNLAMLDFASAVCRVRNPKHDLCPMRDICNYYRRTWG